MNDYESSAGGGKLLLLIVVFLVTLGAGLLTLGMVDNITENKAVTAQQATLQERARADAAIAEAKAQSEIERERELGRTERWEAFLTTINAARPDLSLLVAATVMVVIVAGLWLSDRRRSR